MASLSDATPRQELVDVIRQVRSRWRTKLLLRGGVIVLLGALVAIVLASVGLQSYKFSPASVIGFRVAIFVTFAGLLGLWLVRPLGRRVSDIQVARTLRA
jgi:protein-S-isoprenylcysteine O-methyltransferase Ste14